MRQRELVHDFGRPFGHMTARVGSLESAASEPFPPQRFHIRPLLPPSNMDTPPDRWRATQSKGELRKALG
jgi:hypothetical protein